MNPLRRYLKEMPIVAILRGLEPEEAPSALAALTNAGIRVIEVPLNSPRPFESLRKLVHLTGEDVLIGAGTVLTADDVGLVAETGARLVVAPNCHPPVIERAKALGLIALPGVATPSEAFAALRCGADGLKMFPGEMLPPAVLKAWLAVLPQDSLLVPVGGIGLENMAEYFAAGAAAVGIGSSLFKPGIVAAELGVRAREFAARCRKLESGPVKRA